MHASQVKEDMSNIGHIIVSEYVIKKFRKKPTHNLNSYLISHKSVQKFIGFTMKDIHKHMKQIKKRSLFSLILSRYTECRVTKNCRS